ncbi:coiled-coil domain-containing protein 112-like [Arctopsyche grandis]|uniref:coiled-coil domain-containing protein 112-like n=1 Tax=Arctopsyche grandis TaxID=121162 RepID=UPI00406D6EFA
MIQSASFTLDATLKQLKVNERTLSTASDTALSRLRCSNITELKNTLDENLRQEKLDIADGCNLVHQSLNQLYKNVVSEEKIKKLDVTYYERHVQELLTQLSSTKAFISEKLESLKGSGIILEEEVNVAERLCNNTTNSLSLKAKPFKIINKPKLTLAFDQDVESFQKFLARTGGHTGSWDDEEHRIFLKLWHKYRLHIFNRCDEDGAKGNFILYEEEFQNAVRQILSDKTLDEISSHMKWMNKYNQLKKLKDTALENWKAYRKVNKCGENSLIDSDSGIVLMNRKQSVDIQIVRQELEHWKSMKKNEKKNNSEIMAEIAIANKELEYLKSEDRKIDKETILKWVNARRFQYEHMEQQKEREENKIKEKKIKQANKKIKEYRARDQANINRRLTIIKKQKEDELHKKIAKMKTKSYREVKGQYAKSTETWSRRISHTDKTKSHSEQKCIINGIEAIPKLAVPKWRRGLIIR